MEKINYSFDGVFDLDEALTMPLPSVNDAVYSFLSIPTSKLQEIPLTMTTFPAVSTPNDAVCTVCKESFNPPHQTSRQIPCGHVYHAHCIATWLSVGNSCPLCRLAVVDLNIKACHE